MVISLGSQTPSHRLYPLPRHDSAPGHRRTRDHFDIIGVAVTAAREEPFHAMAVDRVSGAQHAVRLIRHADKVANFANDMVGDVAGTLSGAVATAVVMRLLLLLPGLKEPVVTTLLVGLIAALTVAGKACGKVIALKYADDIVLAVGRLLYWLEKGTGLPS